MFDAFIGGYMVCFVVFSGSMCIKAVSDKRKARKLNKLIFGK